MRSRYARNVLKRVIDATPAPAVTRLSTAPLPDIKACPCGSTVPPRQWGFGRKSLLSQLKCRACGLKGYARATYREQIKAWNERASDKTTVPA